MKRDLKSKEELLKSCYFHFIEQITVESCSQCNGIGRIFSEELTDYHKGEYSTLVRVCQKCNGDGRVVIKSRKITAKLSEDMVSIPFSEFSGDPFGKDNYVGENIRLREDKSNSHMERLYPELIPLKYENYDIKLNECLTHHKLKTIKKE